MNDNGFLFVCGVAFIFICFAHAECPENPQDAFGNCLTGLRIGSSAGRSLDFLDEDGDQIKAICKSNKISEVTKCLRKLTDECENTKFVKELKKSFDIKRWGETVKLLCNNIDYIIENKECMKQNRASAGICIEKENKKFQAKLQKVMAGNPDEEEVRDLTCRLNVEMWKCTRESLKDSCPGKMLGLVKDAYRGFASPFCDDYYESYAVVKSGSVFLVCVAAVVATVYGFLNMI